MQPELAIAVDRVVTVLAGSQQVCVAYSGGLDSTVLLHLVATHVDLPLVALHINHQLHPDARIWEQHCRQQCLALGVPLEIRAVAVAETGDGPEAAARDARYRAFETQLGEGEALLLAQHLDDQAETLLLRLLRGAGREGLAGMPVRRNLGRGWLLRPLLDVPRSILHDYALEHDLSWIEDPSNSALRFDRNYLRHEVMPLLEKRWPAYRRTFARSAGHLSHTVNAGWDAAPPLRCSAVGDPGFAVSDLPRERKDVAHALRCWLRGRGLRMPSSAQLEEFLVQLSSGAGAQLRTRSWVLERYRDAVYCYLPCVFEPPPSIDMYLGRSVVIGSVGRVTLADGGDEPPAVSLTYSLRFRGGGERLRQADGSHADLKTLFQSLQVPPWWRARTPLLFCGESLLAVGRFRRAALPEADSLALCWEPELASESGAVHSSVR